MLSEPERGSISLPQRVAQRPRVSSPPLPSTLHLPISMSVRSFTVFQDTPAEHPQSHDVTDVRTMTLSAADAAATLLSTLAAIEKENLHPLTGQRAGPTIASETKKRKTGALATKVLVVSKKHKELKGEPKKTRKPLSSTGKPRSSDAKKNGSKSSRSSRKPSPLPPVAEEHELQRQPPRLSISQTDIDSRCYELTVSPLADVSEAYEATRTDSQEPDVHTQRVRTSTPLLSQALTAHPGKVDRTGHP